MSVASFLCLNKLFKDNVAIYMKLSLYITIHRFNIVKSDSSSSINKITTISLSVW